MKVPPLSPPTLQMGRQNADGTAFTAPRGVAPARKSRDQVDPQIRAAAEGMEAMFLNTMLQAMRGTVQENEFSLENPATKIYRGMLDSEIASKTAKNNSVGLADQVIAYLESRGYNGNKAPVHGRTKPVAAQEIQPQSSQEVRTGGTDESESIR